jgi:hypothetical protein
MTQQRLNRNDSHFADRSGFRSSQLLVIVCIHYLFWAEIIIAGKRKCTGWKVISKTYFLVRS